MDLVSRSGGWGFVVRDAFGEVAGVGDGYMAHVQDALHTEACLQALLLSQAWGISRVHIETDSQQLVQAIEGSDQDLSRNGAIFREIKFQLSLNFFIFRISYCPRACNRVADAMAAHGAKLGPRSQAVWLGYAPDFVSVLVASDIAGLTR
jgi:ribonuclease HI